MKDYSNTALLHALSGYLEDQVPGITFKTAKGPLKWYLKSIGAGAITIGNTIYFMPGTDDFITMAHESVHVAQARKHGKLKFWFNYLLRWPFFSNKYRVLYELEAYSVSYMMTVWLGMNTGKDMYDIHAKYTKYITKVLLSKTYGYVGKNFPRLTTVTGNYLRRINLLLKFGKDTPVKDTPELSDHILKLYEFTRLYNSGECDV